MNVFKIIIWFFFVMACCIAPELESEYWKSKILSLAILLIGFMVFFLY